MPCRYSRYDGDWAAGAFGTVGIAAKRYAAIGRTINRATLLLCKTLMLICWKVLVTDVIFRSARGDGGGGGRTSCVGWTLKIIIGRERRRRRRRRRRRNKIINKKRERRKKKRINRANNDNTPNI